MAYRLWRSSAFLDDLDAFGGHCADYHPDFAEEQFTRLTFAIETLIAESPLTWGFFIHSRPPHRAYLFRVGQRTQFWIVYSLDEASMTIKLLRLWGAARDPRRFST